MIKATVKNPLNGREYFMLGFTDVEMDRLKAGDPLGLVMEAFPFHPKCPDNIIVVYAPNDEAVKARISAMQASPVGISEGPFPRNPGGN